MLVDPTLDNGYTTNKFPSLAADEGELDGGGVEAHHLLGKRVEPLVEDVVRVPHDGGLQHVAAPPVPAEKRVVEVHVEVAGLIVERHHVHSDRPHEDGVEVGRVHAHAGRVAAHQEALGVVEHAQWRLAADALGPVLVDGGAVVDGGAGVGPALRGPQSVWQDGRVRPEIWFLCKCISLNSQVIS